MVTIQNISGEHRPYLETTFHQTEHKFQKLIIGSGSPKHKDIEGEFTKVLGRFDQVLKNYASRTIYYNIQSCVSYIELPTSDSIKSIEYNTHEETH